MTGERMWDAVVVGSGLGGLTCAAYLAAAGMSVLVLEQHDVAGGNAHVFRRRRSYEFDVGVHYLGDCGPGGTLPMILGGVGVADRVTFRPMDADGFDRIVLPGLTFDVPADWGRYRDRLIAAFPAEAAGIDLYLTVCRAVAGVQPDEPLMRTWRRRTLADLFAHCGLSARVRTVLAAQSGNYGLAPADAPVLVHARMLGHYLRGAAFPEGGGQVLVAALVEAIEADGGEVRTRCAVRRIDVEDGRAAGVTLHDGTRIRAGVVVSNADYRRTVLELTEGFSPATVAKAEASRPSSALAVLYVGLGRTLPERGNHNVWWYRGDDIEAWYAGLSGGASGEVDMAFCSFASIKDPGNPAVCPPGHANFQVMTVCPPGYDWLGVPGGPAGGVPYRRDPAYQRVKSRLTDAMLDAAEQVLGPVRADVTHLELATPLTQERYTGSTGGTPYGIGRWGNAVAARPDFRTTIGGLFLTGQSTRYGSGVAGVMLGGVVCAGEVLGRPLLDDVTAGAVSADPARLPERPEGWDPLAVSRGVARRSARGLARIGGHRTISPAVTATPARAGST
ncbi:NAD(P)/FAD-dependent oxidoreductase [Actinoplanes missouriensis]|uniref:phytoene desaturase family protein n=1 Tax=Actinoplanes missouriensis TaxID=1866 RepID=UPI0034059501